MYSKSLARFSAITTITMLIPLVLLLLSSEATCVQELLVMTDISRTNGDMIEMVDQQDDDHQDVDQEDDDDEGIRAMLSEASEEFSRLLQPGFTAIVGALTIWSIMKIIAKSINLLTATENMKANFLNFFHEAFKTLIITAVETGFYDNLYEGTNPVLSNLFSISKPKTEPIGILQNRKRRDVKELTKAAYKAFDKYNDIHQ